MKQPMSKLIWSTVAGLSAMTGAATAAVQDAKEGAFSTQAVILVELPPSAAYRAMTQLPGWWDPAHTWAGSAKNLVLEPRAGGCFCEKLAGGGSVQHARVVFAQPGKQLRLVGALGPLQDMAVTGVLTFTLAPDGPGTRITLTYRVSGALTMDATKLAPGVDQVLTTQLERLRTYANSRARR
jgi:uncharacterized protein YndB with AHSA1/START domain